MGYVLAWRAWESPSVEPECVWVEWASLSAEQGLKWTAQVLALG
jgi:hypothetical protein